MRHDWQDYADPTKSSAQRFLAEPERRCANCGTIQQRVRETAWMRIVRVRWLPLAGRCSGALLLVVQNAPMPPLSSKEKQEAFRARNAMLGLVEVRGIFLPPELHAELKEHARKLAAKSDGLQKLSDLNHELGLDP